MKCSQNNALSNQAFAPLPAKPYHKPTPAAVEATPLAVATPLPTNITYIPLMYNGERVEDNLAEDESDTYYEKEDCSIQEYEIMKVWNWTHISLEI